MEYVKTTMIDTLLDLVAPHRCGSCEEIGSVLCESCKYDIVSEAFSGCVLCTRPCGERGLCETCGRASRIRQAWCVGERRGGLKTVLDAYKFDSARAASGICADLLNTLLPELPPDIAVVSVPSSPGTVRSRGFDHMGRIADEFARRRGLERARPVERASDAILHFLPRAERLRLGDSLFSLSGAPVPATILVLDDIVTTGTTLTAITKLLYGAGAQHVYAAVVARQPDD